MIIMSGYDQQRLSVYKGVIGERLAVKYLRKQGFQVMSYMQLVDFTVNIPRKMKTLRERMGGNQNNYNIVKKALEKKHSHRVNKLYDWMENKVNDFIKMNKAFDKIYLGKEHRRRALDFIAKKDDKFYAVEVKTNSSKLSEKQRKELELSKKFGFTPIIIKTKVTLIANLTDVELLNF